jgi:type II secretory pathway pseudopilin PulG
MKRLATLIVLGLASGLVLAKLPPLSDEAKAKAAETAAKTAWSDKVAGFQLCKALDRVAAAYQSDARKAGKDVKPTATPACTDPGAFSYTPPDAKPAEAAGAHSPPQTAATPPSSKTPAAALAPAK